MSWRKLEEWSLRLARATKFARRVAANPVGMRLSAAVTLTPVSYGHPFQGVSYLRLASIY
jgi:hypothetical protein